MIKSLPLQWEYFFRVKQHQACNLEMFLLQAAKHYLSQLIKQPLLDDMNIAQHGNRTKFGMMAPSAYKRIVNRRKEEEEFMEKSSSSSSNGRSKIHKPTQNGFQCAVANQSVYWLTCLPLSLLDWVSITWTCCTNSVLCLV